MDAPRKQLPIPRPSKGARLAPWSPVASREEVRAYLQQRMALLSKLLFWIFWILVIFVLALYEIFPETEPANTTAVHRFAIGGLIALGIIWYFALHRDECSIETLYRIDILYALVIGAAFGVSAYYTSDRIANVYSAFIWQTFMVFTRVVIVPSTGRRTAGLTAASYVPLVVASIATATYVPERVQLPPVALVLGTIMFAAVATVLATTGSRVIYGLRRQVRQAEQLGQYTLDEKIGEGGMGAVYKARHAMLRRPTAIKLLPLDKYGAESAARFEREVQLTAQLSHPNTVAIFDYGRSPDGLFYYAMEYLEGVDLERLVRRDGPQDPARVVRIVVQVCGALQEAHELGLIHRDIKPANVLLCARGGVHDTAKVVDFGLVAEVGSGAQSASGIEGTPAFLSPEAVTDPSKVGPASDLYSLGAVAYYLLSGTRVFRAAKAVDLCVMHASQAPEPLSARARRAVPAALEALVMRCLAKDPAARPASAGELASALRALVDDGVVEAWSEDDARAWWDHYRARYPVGTDTASDAHPVTVTVDLRDRVDPASDTVPLKASANRE